MKRANMGSNPTTGTCDVMNMILTFHGPLYVGRQHGENGLDLIVG